MDTTTGGKKSAWMVHVKKTMRAHKGMKLGQVLKLAAKSYRSTAKKSKKTKKGLFFGGQDPMAAPPATGPVAPAVPAAPTMPMMGGYTSSSGPGVSTAGEVGGQMGASRRRRRNGRSRKH